MLYYNGRQYNSPSNINLIKEISRCASAYSATAGGATFSASAVQDGIVLSSVFLAGCASPLRCKTLIRIAADAAPGQATAATFSATEVCAAPQRPSRCTVGS